MMSHKISFKGVIWKLSLNYPFYPFLSGALFSDCTISSYLPIQVDDMKDESLSAVIEDITPPTGMELCNTQIFPGYPQHSMMYNLQVSRRYNPPSLSLSPVPLSAPNGMEFSYL